MRVIFSGGGTAGHVTPAIAIAEALIEKEKNCEILFIGREGGEENKAVEDRGFPIETLRIKGFERKINFTNIKNVFVAINALNKAKSIIKDFSPDVVIGTGGYVCWPVLKSAAKLGIPTVIHESNASPGLVTKLLAPKCSRVLLNLKGSEKEFRRKDNIRIVGNPVREDFFSLNKGTARKKLGIKKNEFLICSFGGSGGAEKLNEIMIELMYSHSTKNKRLKHVHSAGKRYFDEIKKAHPELTRGYNGCLIKPYIDDMPSYILAADIVISRCGAMTLAELSAAGSVAILIPSPNVTNNHQYKNALLATENSAAVMIEEKNLNLRRILDEIKRLESDSATRKTLSENMTLLCNRNSKNDIADEIINLTKK